MFSKKSQYGLTMALLLMCFTICTLKKYDYDFNTLKNEKYIKCNEKKDSKFLIQFLIFLLLKLWKISCRN